MKQIVEDKEAATHLENLIGESVVIFCMNYIYAGTLISLNDTSLELADACIVYETGKLDDSGFQDSQRLPENWHVALHAIEAFGEMK